MNRECYLTFIQKQDGKDLLSKKIKLESLNEMPKETFLISFLTRVMRQHHS